MALFGWRRRIESQLEVAIAEVWAVAQESRMSTDAAEAAAASAREALSSINVDDSKDRSAWRFLRLAMFCLVCLAGSLLIGSSVLAAFY
jgi:hypothetical protein